MEEFDGLTKRKYLVSPHHCPFCGVEERLEYCESEADYGEAWFTFRCMDCSEKWIEIYTLSSIEPLNKF